MLKDKFIRTSSKFSKTQLLVFVLVFASIGSYIIYRSFASGPGTANVFVAPNGSDSGANCKRFMTLTANPDSGGTSLCASFDEAYQVAVAGDIIEVAAGIYGPQTINKDATKTTCCVTFRPSQNATVTTTGSVVIRASHVQFTGSETAADLEVLPTISIPKHGFDFRALAVRDTSSNTALQPDNVVLDSVSMGSQSSLAGTNITLKNSNIYGSPGAEDLLTTVIINGYRGYNHLIDHNVFHDQISTGLGHQDCLQLYIVDDSKVSRNKFVNCISADLIYKADSAPPPQTNDNFIVENNIFSDNKVDIYAMQLTRDSAAPPTASYCSNVVFRYNTMGEHHGKVLKCGASAASIQVYGNIFASGGYGCASTATWQYNVIFPGSSGCVATDFVSTQTLTQLFINPIAGESGDWHLAPNSQAIGRGDPTNCPPIDIDGNPRPQGSACDAGADEYVSGSGSCPAGDFNSDCHVNIRDLSIMLSNWNSTTNVTCDLNSNGTIDIFDLSILLSHYGS